MKKSEFKPFVARKIEEYFGKKILAGEEDYMYSRDRCCYDSKNIYQWFEYPTPSIVIRERTVFRGSNHRSRRGDVSVSSEILRCIPDFDDILDFEEILGNLFTGVILSTSFNNNYGDRLFTNDFETVQGYYEGRYFKENYAEIGRRRTLLKKENKKVPDILKGIPFVGKSFEESVNELFSFYAQLRSKNA